PSCSTPFPYTTLFRSADLHEGDAITSLPDVRVQPPLAPGIVQLEHHPQPGRADVVHEVEGVGEGVQEAEVDAQLADGLDRDPHRSEEHTSELQSLTNL